jgi:hypothetical protein
MIMGIIPDNILLGVNDELPGVSGSKLPQNPDDILAICKVVNMRTVYAHNVRITSMNEIDNDFSVYLKNWKQNVLGLKE